MNRLIFIILLNCICWTTRSFSQTNPRMENPQYTKTIFYDDFNTTQLDRSVWNVSAHGIREGSEHKKLFIWVDSIRCSEYATTLATAGADLQSAPFSQGFIIRPTNLRNKKLSLFRKSNTFLSNQMLS